mmetsp:Transcript_23380/g.57938  ORF Transcript_23380/g.57938 Transcript_23380/m.57938 type:complete len:302 (-) Transcript_23380:581-1486(-)
MGVLPSRIAAMSALTFSDRTATTVLRVAAAPAPDPASAECGFAPPLLSRASTALGTHPSRRPATSSSSRKFRTHSSAYVVCAVFDDVLGLRPTLMSSSLACLSFLLRSSAYRSRTRRAMISDWMRSSRDPRWDSHSDWSATDRSPSASMCALSLSISASRSLTVSCRRKRRAPTSSALTASTSALPSSCSRPDIIRSCSSIIARCASADMLSSCCCASCAALRFRSFSAARCNVATDFAPCCLRAASAASSSRFLRADSAATAAASISASSLASAFPCAIVVMECAALSLPSIVDASWNSS